MHDSSIKVKIGICPNRDVELYQALSQVPLRRRAERLRALALAGLNSAPTSCGEPAETFFSVPQAGRLAIADKNTVEDDRRSSLMSLMRTQLSRESK